MTAARRTHSIAKVLSICRGRVRGFSQLHSSHASVGLGHASTNSPIGLGPHRLISTTPSEKPILASACDLRVYDTADRVYLDFSSIDTPLGHSPPSVVVAVAAQLGTHAYHSTPTLPHALSKNLADTARRVFNSEGSVFFDSRDAALEASIALARRGERLRGSQRSNVLFVRSPPLTTSGGPAACIQTLGNAWRGSYSIGTASGVEMHISGGKNTTPCEPEYGFAVVAPDDAEAIQRALREGSICAVVVEPLQLDAGLIPFRDGFLRSLLKSCRQADALLIVDERRTGLGRCGRLFAWEREAAFQPDMTLAGAGLVSGMLPFSCVFAHGLAGNAALNGAWDSLRDPEVSCALACSPLGAAAAIATMKVLESPSHKSLMENVDSLGEAWRKRIRKRIAGVDSKTIPIHVRNSGLATAVSVGGPDDSLAAKIVERMAHNGVLTACERNVIFMLPPVDVSKRNLERAATVFRQSLKFFARK